MYGKILPYTFLILDGVKDMYNKISKKLTETFIKHDVIKSDDYEVYKYGFELLFALVFTTLLIVVISFILGRFIETTFYLLGFLVVRTICGGYHTKHHFSCFIMTILSYLLFLIIHHYFEQKSHINLATFFSTIISAFILIAFAPIEHPNNPMTEYQKNKSRLLSVILSIIIMLVSFISLFFDVSSLYNLSLSIGISFATFTILAAKIETSIFKRKEDLL